MKKLTVVSSTSADDLPMNYNCFLVRLCNSLRLILRVVQEKMTCVYVSVFGTSK